MKIKKLRFIYNSISFKTFLIIIVILAPLLTLLIYNNYKAREILLEQVKGTHRNMLQSYLTQIDAQLKSSMGYTLDMALFQTDPQILVANKDEDTLVFAKDRIYKNLSNMLISNTMIDTFFLYIKSENYFIIASQHGVSSSELDALKNYIIPNSEESVPDDPRFKSKWVITQLGESIGLINMSFSNKKVISGSYTNTDRLLSSYIPKNPAAQRLSFIPNDTLDMETSKLQPKTLLITNQSSIANIALIEILPEEVFLNSLPFIQKYIFQFSIVLAFMLPILILLMKLIVVDPLQRLTKSMLRVHNGDLTHRIKPQRSSNEFEIVNSTFNEMMDEVQNLKINVYEEQIKVQRSQLRNLQLQIKPHFLINSLNMVNNLILNEKYSSATDLILHSVDYFRYMTKADEDYVHLNEEIKHVTTYLEIQRIRYKDKFTYSISINQLIEDMLVPPLLIQSFIENSMKYAIEMGKVLNISINVEYFEVDYYPYAKIVISDTGIGYPVNLLEHLNAGKKISDSMGDHIGIQNSVNRIKILYEGKASWKFYNNGGAVSELILPALFENE